MAITLDNTTQGSVGGTTLTLSFTAAANTLIIVAGECENTNATMSATWNGNAMTLDKQINSASLGQSRSLLSIFETTGGTHNIVVTGGAGYTEANVASFFGCANGHAIGTDSAAILGTTSLTSTIDTTGFNNALHIASASANTTNTPGAGTQIIGIVVDNSRLMFASSPLSVTPAGSNSISITFSITNALYAGAAYAAASAVVVNSGFFFAAAQ